MNSGQLHPNGGAVRNCKKITLDHVVAMFHDGLLVDADNVHATNKSHHSSAAAASLCATPGVRTSPPSAVVNAIMAKRSPGSNVAADTGKGAHGARQ